ncbi:hypothetical protein [Lactovum odontotermitis]
MAVLAILQRATLLKLSSEVTEISTMDGEKEKQQQKKIFELHERYIKAQNQIMLEEVTVEEQGVELFDIIRKGLYIPERDKELKDQIMNLNALATARYEENQTARGWALNIIVAILGVLAIFACMRPWSYIFKDVELPWTVLIPIVALVFVFLLMAILTRIIIKRRKK